MRQFWVNLFILQRKVLARVGCVVLLIFYTPWFFVLGYGFYVLLSMCFFVWVYWWLLNVSGVKRVVGCLFSLVYEIGLNVES
jgi:uncharacterized BrkB/YihY/UPF0761 family membrane protein